ncbi:hypothetical protein [Halobaculum rubrum]|uniref:hypothetical protein n=1 Tax=Halobaculum rubrum TaxID=2872158 RepID=UPI001CA38B10|nr:hypothetical protein [Halobaculum rubrum]QZY01182.1 hypothetical protein K6T25_15455 [Halobaculum rubrum]
MPELHRRQFIQLAGSGLGAVPVFSTSSLGTNSARANSQDRQFRDRIGVNHVDGNYHLTDDDYLNEGAKQIRDLGSRVIKLWFHHIGTQGEQKYRYNSDWPEQFTDMVEIARHEYFRELFQRDFRTYVLVAYSMNDSGGFSHGEGGKHYFRHGVSDAQLQHEEESFYELTAHLLEEYHGTGKEFILQHWQGDWAILPFSARDEVKANQIREDDQEPTATAVEGMIQWLNARQRGVNRARQEIDSDVKVLHAAEVNMVRRAMRGQRRVINQVVPESTVDLVSHNSYREMWAAHRRWNPNEAPQKMRDILDFVNQHAPTPGEYVTETLVDPDKNVFIGEYGLPLTWVGDKNGTRISKLATNVSLDWGATWTLYWQIYGNEDGKGFWLIRPDGSKTPLYEYFKRIISENSLPQLPEYTSVVFSFNRAVLEHEVNEDVSKADSRWLTFACSQLEFLDGEGTVIKSYDIGDPMHEPVLSGGTSWPAEHGGRSWRWFVGEDARTAQTYIYIPAEIAANAAALRITGRPVQQVDLEVTITVGDESAGTIDIPENSRWQRYSLEFASAPTGRTSTPTPTTTESSTGTTSLTPAESSPTGSAVESTSNSQTAVSQPGFTVPLTAIGITGGLGLLRYFKTDPDGD